MDRDNRTYRLHDDKRLKQELKRHVENTHETAPEGSHPYRLHYGSRATLDALEDDETPLTQVTSVPRPHGADAGEESLRQGVVQNPEAIDYVILMDAAGARFAAPSPTVTKRFMSWHHCFCSTFSMITS